MKLCLDAGHGGSDPGAVHGDLIEKDLTLRLAKLVESDLYMRFSDIKVIQTRTNDSYVSLAERARLANQAGADYFVSLHFNAGGGTGFESYSYIYVPEKTMHMNRIFHETLANMLPFRDRGQKEANFQVLRDTKMPAILIECCFLDHPDDSAWLRVPGNLEYLATAISRSCAISLGLVASGSGGIVPLFFELRRGMKGNDVRIIQVMLKQFGFGYSQVDGIYGELTEKAVKDFQKKYKLNPTGVFDRRTLEAVCKNTP